MHTRPRATAKLVRIQAIGSYNGALEIHGCFALGDAGERHGDRMNAQVHGTSAHEVRAAWIEAARLRTLPLAASGSLIAAGLAAARGAFRAEVFILMFVVSALLQVIANFADDYGDLAHGLDDETRVGPKRGMQRGIITPSQMKRALFGTCALTFALGCLLIWVSFLRGPALDGNAVAAMGVFLAFGIAAIAAAVFYTVGPHPYGYMGLGDIMSFIFFGLVAVCAGSFLYLHRFDPASLVAGVALGLPVAAVMNINNMRDSLDDATKGKHTIANRLYALGEGACSRGEKRVNGERAMRTYHTALLYLSLILFVAFIFVVKGFSLRTFVAGAAICLSFQPLMSSLAGIVNEPDHTKLDRFMAPTSLGTVAVAIVVTICLAIA